VITQLKPHERFVFGSNILGSHGGGAAKQAHEQFGAEWGVGEGLTGQCYAFPTLNANMQQYDHVEMASIRAAFYRCARAHPELTFLLTKVGCGIAGYSEEYIKDLFSNPPTNVEKVGWN
jgi:hypothetical protein